MAHTFGFCWWIETTFKCIGEGWLKLMTKIYQAFVIDLTFIYPRLV